ncbi:hypothetical protein [Mesorhizobium sp. B2-8-5]|uniref:hypothetical protein n=1 Tax=Mesorhizobium sp. B2-8-5 TaxID=2589903 RepID=UPI0011265183|nr:hypothetical protein [Mesorhizobium sp. B2-8-5]UCI23697.1 hypothetical protein FJ430_18960 [Mesorhizobium sp. B2-8-5]
MITARDIIDALIALSDGRIWASELGFFSGARRIDFWTLEPTHSQGFRASAYEIKISRGDFLRDSIEKQDGALRWSDRFWYVTSPGVLTVADLPEWAGLQEWDGESFRVRRKAPPRVKEAPDWELIVSLLRNSGDCRRDVGLIKAQAAYLQSRVDQLSRQEKMRMDLQFRRWTCKHSKAVQA